jgi:hypothetical protein
VKFIYGTFFILIERRFQILYLLEDILFEKCSLLLHMVSSDTESGRFWLVLVFCIGTGSGIPAKNVRNDLSPHADANSGSFVLNRSPLLAVFDMQSLD